jgi:hypothetical protein
MVYESQLDCRSNVRREWQKRFSMSFPFRLSVTGKVVDDMWGIELDDETLPSHVLDQANRLREKLKKG